MSLRAAGVVPTDTDSLDDLTVSRRSPSDGPKTRAIAVIDQFEELFTACRDPEIRQQFVATIVDASAPCPAPS